MSKKLVAALFVLSFALGIITKIFIFPSKETVIKEPMAEKSVVVDTIVKIVPSEPLVISKTKMKLIKIRDTLIVTAPFEAKLDTVVRSDTVKALYEFPENLFSLEIKKKPDSLRFETVTIFRTIEKERPWWEMPACILGGTTLGFLLGKAVK